MMERENEKEEKENKEKEKKERENEGKIRGNLVSTIPARTLKGGRMLKRKRKKIRNKE